MFRQCQRLTISLIALSVFTAGCVVTPEPLSGQDHVERSQQDLDNLRSVEFVPTKPIELHEAMARAVAFNLRYRVAQIEKDIANAELEKNNFELLPTLELNADRSRSDVQISSSDDRITNTASATFAWNILDLGVSYARANQQADEVLITQEQERKALQDIIRQVNAAFWRAAAGQQLLIKVHAIARDLQTAMKASREMERTRATDIISAVGFRRDIVESVKQSLAIKRELNEAKAELAELLNIRPGTDFELALPAMKAGLPRLPMSVEKLEVFALENRPELRVEKYNERISDWQAREALYNLLPGLKLTVGRNYSGESTNLSPNWISTGVNMGMNLFKLFSGSSEIEIAEEKAELARRQRLALSMAVLTQVHMSRIKFHSAAQQMRLAHEIAESDRTLTRLVRTDGKFLKHDYFEAIRLATRQLQSEMDEQRSYVDLVSAQADLMHAIGLDLLPDTVPYNDVAALSDAIRAMMVQWTISDGTAEESLPARPLDQLVDSMISVERRGDIMLAQAEPNQRIEEPPKAPIETVAEALFTTGMPEEIDTADLQPEIEQPITQAPAQMPQPGNNDEAPAMSPAATGPALADAEQPGIDQTENDITQATVEQLNQIAPASQGDPSAKLPYERSWEFSIQPLKLRSLSENNGQHLVQLGAFQNDANAIKLFIRLTAEPLAALKGTELNISYGADRQGKNFYFVHTGALKNRSSAEVLCRSLKRAGQSCLVATKQN